MADEWDVVVVGAGTSGCALAARLADAGRRVLLLEAGADHARPADFPPELRDAATMRAAVPGHPANWDLTGELTTGLTVPVPRGRVVGGSSALNAGSFIRGTRADFDGWAADGNDLWSYDAVLPAFRRLEADRDFGDLPGHGADGPVPVTRVPDGHPLADAFTAAAEDLGHPGRAGQERRRGSARLRAGTAERGRRRPDQHGDGLSLPPPGAAGAHRARRGDRPPGAGRARPRGRRRDRRGDRPGRRGGALRGAVGSPHLLLLSGIGGASDLRRAGIDVVADVPGVGAEFTDHPTVYVGFRPVRPLPPAPLPLHGVLHATSAGSRLPGDLEILPWLTPFSRITGGPDDDELVIGAGLQREESRGRLTLDDGDPRRPPRLAYGYLTQAPDRRRLREAVRLAAGLLRTRSLAGLVARTNLRDDVLDDDPEPRRLDPGAPDDRDPLVPAPRGWDRTPIPGPSSTSGYGSAGSRACGSWTRRSCRGSPRAGRPRPP